MQRPLKFRAWVNNKQMWTPELRSNWEMLRDAQEEFEAVIMQYTGLKDKNGVEIYEGDIVKLRLHDAPDKFVYEVGVIRWNESASGYKWYSGDESDLNNYWLTHADTKEREVIGNIYENPELLTAPQRLKENQSEE